MSVLTAVPTGGGGIVGLGHLVSWSILVGVERVLPGLARGFAFFLHAVGGGSWRLPDQFLILIDHPQELRQTPEILGSDVVPVLNP